MTLPGDCCFNKIRPWQGSGDGGRLAVPGAPEVADCEVVDCSGLEGGRGLHVTPPLQLSHVHLVLIANPCTVLAGQGLLGSIVLVANSNLLQSTTS